MMLGINTAALAMRPPQRCGVCDFEAEEQCCTPRIRTGQLQEYAATIGADDNDILLSNVTDATRVECLNCGPVVSACGELTPAEPVYRLFISGGLAYARVFGRRENSKVTIMARITTPTGHHTVTLTTELTR